MWTPRGPDLSDKLRNHDLFYKPQGPCELTDKPMALDLSDKPRASDLSDKPKS